MANAVLLALFAAFSVFGGCCVARHYAARPLENDCRRVCKAVARRAARREANAVNAVLSRRVELLEEAEREREAAIAVLSAEIAECQVRLGITHDGEDLGFSFCPEDLN